MNTTFKHLNKCFSDYRIDVRARAVRWGAAEFVPMLFWYDGTHLARRAAYLELVFGGVEPLPTIYKANPDGESCTGAACTKRGAVTSILIDASTRATRRTRDISADFWKIHADLSATPVQGRPPKHVMVTGGTFPRGHPRSIGSKGSLTVDPKW